VRNIFAGQWTNVLSCCELERDHLKRFTRILHNYRLFSWSTMVTCSDNDDARYIALHS